MAPWGPSAASSSTGTWLASSPSLPRVTMVASRASRMAWWSAVRLSCLKCGGTYMPASSVEHRLQPVEGFGEAGRVRGEAEA